MRTITITSIEKRDVDSLQRVGVVVFKRVSNGKLLSGASYFAEVLDGRVTKESKKKALPLPRRGPKLEKTTGKTMLRLATKVPKFQNSGLQIARAYVAARTAMQMRKGKQLRREQIVSEIQQRTGLTQIQSTNATCQLLTIWKAFEVVA